MLFKISSFLTVSWFCFMTYLSHQNGEQTRKASEGMTDLFGIFLQGESYWKLHSLLRQSAHVFLFAVFAVLLLFTISLKWNSWKCYMLAVGFMTIWAWMDEATKPMIPGRHFAWYDVRLNIIGMVIGIMLFAGMQGIWKKNK